MLSPVYSQDESAIKAIISESDLKKLVKADGYKSEAETLIEEANQLNMEVFTVQANPDMNERAIKKRVEQLENDARQKNFQASALYEKGNEIKFSLYKQYIDKFWKSHEGDESNYLNEKLLEEQASDNYFQAVSYRIEAKKMDDGYAKVEKLNDANNLEMQAVQKQLITLAAYYNIIESTNPVLPDEDSTADEVSQPAEEAPVVTFEPLPDHTPDSVSVTEVSMPESITDTTVYSPMIALPESFTPASVSEDALMTVSNNIIFRVQVAASRVPLTIAQLKEIYQGIYQVEMLKEDSWYKYQFPGVPLYSDALKIVRSLNKQGVFVVAYKDGRKITLAEAIRLNRELETATKSLP